MSQTICPQPASSRYKAYVFDLDGTLLDTLADLALACNTTLERHGFPVHPLPSFRIFVGNGFLKLVERALPADFLAKAPRDEVLAILQEAKTFYTEHLRVNTKPYAGIPELVQKLKARGATLAVLSNKPDPQTKALIADIFPGIFTLVYGQRPDVPLKPDPAALLGILAELGVTKEETVYVGDTGTDMETGRRAGLFTIGVSWGFRTEEELRSTGADAVVQHPDELAQF